MPKTKELYDETTTALLEALGGAKKIEAPKVMYVAASLRGPESLEMVNPIGIPVKVRIDMPGCVGFLPVFDNPEAAKEYGNGRFFTIERTESAAAPKGGTEA